MAGLSFFVFFLLFSNTTQAIPGNTAPVFVYGPSHSVTVCAGVANDISSWLAVVDPDLGQTETWKILEGSVAGLPTTAPSGGTVTPTGVSYTPGSGVTNDFLEIQVSDGIGEPATIFLIINVNPQPSVTLGANPAVCAGADSASILYSGLTNVGPDTVVFNIVGNAIPWTVPAGVTSLQFDVQGARGGRQNATPGPYMPGYGGRVQGTLAVTPGEQLFFSIGGVGADGSGDGASGGVGGGGNSNSFIYGSGGGGGGASGISFDGSWLVIAGGGGGDGWDSTGDRAGGAGGGLIGGNSAINGGGSATNFAAGGSQLAGGAGATYPGWVAGSDGSAFQGGDGSTQGISGGGGGGYYGGGGGVWTGGGGGSSYTDPDQVTAFTHTSGYDSTNGIITITYVIPGTYSIVWSDSAHAHGFVDVTGDPIPAAAFPIVVPAGAPAAVYSGSLTVSSTTCSSIMNPFSVKVKPIPSVNLYAGQTVCNGDSTNDITFGGGPAGVIFQWVNDNTDFGLGPNGTTKIARFLPINPFNYPDSATITVTPVDSGCAGEPMSFELKDNPIPRLNSTLVPPSICDSTLFPYHPTTTVTDPGTTYAWSRAAIAGITNTGTTGVGDVSEVLVNTADTSIPVAYQYVLNFMGCMDTQNVVVNVYPHPILTSTLTPSPVCSGSTFSYEPTSNVALTDFAWSRAVQYGISNGAGGGAGGPEESLMDTTAFPQLVTYVFTLTPTGSTCNYSDTVTVTVNPTPMLNTPLNAGANCTRDTFTYIPGSNTTGTAFTWSREEISGLTNPGTSDSGIVHELLVNPNTYPVVVSYTYFLRANGCPNSQTVTDTVKPTPTLNSTLTPDSICNNTVFTYTATSLTVGTSFAWVRDSIAGIIESADSAMSASIDEVLISNQPGVIPVTYVYTLTAEGCSNVQDVVVKVNPTPVLNNNPSVATTCDNTVYNFTPASNTSGATYSWTRLYVPGIENLGSSSTGSTGVISESLDNTTYVNVNTTYYYTITANGCTNTENVVLTVHPEPKLSTDTTATICSGAPFNYYPDSYTPTTTYTWSNTSVPGVSPTGVSGAGNVSAVFTSSLTTAATVVYTYTLTAYGCTNTENVTVTVNPTPSLVDITVHPSNSACDNTLYQNFGAAVPPGPGMTYNWVVDNGYVWAKGTDGQYCLVNFNNPGTAVVYLFINDSLGCQNNNGFTVAVSSAANISPEVIYFNQQLICKDADVDNYQWGYDDAVTLDSTAIAGANNQNYSITNLEAGRYYWVITNRGGCTQKSYYNAPASTTGIANVNANQPEMKIFPNPAAEFINVELLNMTGGNVNVTITNMLGQKVSSVMTAGSEAKIDVTGLPAGCYMVDCYSEGVKIAGAKFIKN